MRIRFESKKLKKFDNKNYDYFGLTKVRKRLSPDDKYKIRLISF